uniref:Oxidation resistance protein 1 n=1 Tax=Macrostomum lignano TaxID=282301 RepID=A0A1I8HHF5_9PLAT
IDVAASSSAEEYDDDNDSYDDITADDVAAAAASAAATASDCSHPDYYRGLLAAMSATPTTVADSTESANVAAALPTRSDLPLPRRLSTSSPSSARRRWLLNRRRLRHVVAALPSRAEGLDLRLVHSARRDGFSLKSAYRACRLTATESCIGAREPYCLLLVATVTGRLFGAFLSAELRVSERRYYGTGETFVFRWERPECEQSHGQGQLAGEASSDNSESDKDSNDGSAECEADKDFYQYAWTGENMFFMRGDLDHFAIGSSGGRCAIWLDADLCRGRSQPCETFNSPVLCGDSTEEDFLVRDLEIWAFVDPTGE